MERAVLEQHGVLFPRMRELEEARRLEDLALRRASVPVEEWSPRRLPYKVYERDSTAADASDEEDEDEEEGPGEQARGRAPSSAPSSASGSSATATQVARAAPLATAEAPAGKPAGSQVAAVGGVIEEDGLQIGIEDCDTDVGLQVGMPTVEEQGFVYKGPEPTLYGDWQHKGRTTDF